jgi:type I restriction enzyme, S subunit
MMQLTEQQKKEGWRIVKFGDVAKEVKGSTKDPLSEGIDRYVGLEHIDSQSVRLSRWGMVEDDNPSFTKKFSAGDILFGRRRAYLKKAAVPDFDGICSGDIIVMAPKGKDLLPEMLPFIVQSDQFFDWAIKHSAGGLSPRTKFKSLADFEFPLPPRKRQEEMLEVLEKVEDNIFKVDDLIQNTEKLFLRNRLELTTQNKGKSVQLGDIVVFKGGSGFKPKFQGNTSGDFPFIKVADMNHLENVKFINNSMNWVNSAEKKEMKATAFPAGAVVFAKVGAALLLNRRRILNRDTIIDNNMMAAMPSEEISTEYLYHLLSTIDFATFVRQGAVPSVNQSDLSSIKIVLPDIAIQNKICAVLDGYEDTINQLLSKKIRNKKLKIMLIEEVSREAA